MRYANIPVFIPHRGCPNACVFCDQHLISGFAGEEDSAALVAGARETVEQALTTLSPDTQCEIAYFGGSFTGIDPELMEALLALAAEYTTAGRVSGIRFSTRPDYLGDDVLRRLARYPVKTVELGVQSLSDRVLSACCRGHSAVDAMDAIARLRAAGYGVTGQMMLGLPGATAEDEFATARGLIEAGVISARIYPTLVLRGTRLAQMLEAGTYCPLSLEDAVERTADLLSLFDAAGVEVLRVGLQETEGLRADTVIAGPHHPAFGELAMGECFFRRGRELLAAHTFPEGKVTLAVPRGRTSAMVGQKKRNLTRLCREFSLKKIKVIEIDKLLGYNIKIVHPREEERDPCI